MTWLLGLLAGSLAIAAVGALLLVGVGSSQPVDLVFSSTADTRAQAVVATAGGEPGQFSPHILDVAPLSVGCILLTEGQGGVRYLGRTDAKGNLIHATEIPCQQAEELAIQDGTLALTCRPLARGTRTLQLRSTSDLSLIRDVVVELVAETEEVRMDFTGGVYSPGLEFVAFASSATAVEVFRLSDGSPVAQLDVPSGALPVGSMAFSPQGDRLAVAHKGGRVDLFETGSWSKVGERRTAEDSGTPTVGFTADGHLVSATHWAYFHLWSPSGELLHSDSVDGYGNYSLALAGDGSIYQVRAGQLVVRDSRGSITGSTPQPASALFGGLPPGFTRGVSEVQSGTGGLYVTDAGRSQVSFGQLIPAPGGSLLGP